MSFQKIREVGSIMKRVFGHLKPYLGMYLLSGLLILFSTIGDLALPGIMKDIVNNGIGTGNTNYILSQGLLMLMITLLSLTCWCLSSLFGAKASFGFARDLRKSAFSKVLDSSVDQIDDIGVASLITRTTTDIATLEMSMFRMLRMGIIAPFTCICAIVLAFQTSSSTALLFIFTIAILAVLSYMIIRKATPLFASTFPKMDAVNRIMRENLVGMRVIRAFNKDEVEEKRFDEANEGLSQTNMKAQRIMTWQSPLITLFMNITILAVLYISSVRIDSGNTLPGELLALIQYATLILNSFMRLNMFFQLLPRTQAATRRITAMLNLETNVEETKKETRQNFENGDITFSNVSFCYGNSQQPVLDDVSFTAKKGKVTAVIGGTGAGKTTIINLLLRFYDVCKGSIVIGGIDVNKLGKSQLRSMLGVVTQSVSLFSGTISDNIAYGCESAEQNDINEAAGIAQAEGFIMEQPAGYDAPLSQMGKNFSGGQKQRLSIARALARKTPVLLFDDSFSALDFKTDSRLRKALRKEKKDTTILIVAQRIATIMDADNIIVLNDGRVEATGTHEQLMKNCEFYREIALSQFSREEVAV